MTTKYQRLADILRESMKKNASLGITKLPTEQALSDQYKVSRQTVRQALSLLQKEGLIQKKRGSGSYPTGLAAGSDKNHIALITSYSDDYIYPALIHDIQSLLMESGYQVNLYSTNDHVSKEREILKDLLRNPVRGLIIEGCKSALPNPNLDLYEKLKLNGVSVVFIHSIYRDLSGFPCIKDDDYSGGYTLVNHLIKQNHSQIGGIFKYDDTKGLDCYHGYLSAMCDAGLSIEEEHIAWFSSEDLNLLRKKQDTSFLLEFIHKQLKSCSAVICHNDEIAYWLIKELKYAGQKVPEDLSVACMNYSYLNDLSPVRITALSHEPHELAKTTVNTLLNMLHGLSGESVNLSLQLLTRNSISALNR
ncbi:MAG: substrate-binding domain-containing protein [Clostridia bacterium]|nr:substrate-binding domain-containing protein [Clostridia bacterium]